METETAIAERMLFSLNYFYVDFDVFESTGKSTYGQVSAFSQRQPNFLPCFYAIDLK